MTRRLFLCFVAVTVAWAVFVTVMADNALDRVDDETAERRVVDRQQVKVICERQETGLSLSAESRKFIRVGNEVLRDLIAISITPDPTRPPPDSREREFIAAFQARADRLEAQIVKLKKGEGKLTRAVNRLDCDRPEEAIKGGRR